MRACDVGTTYTFLSSWGEGVLRGSHKHGASLCYCAYVLRTEVSIYGGCLVLCNSPPRFLTRHLHCREIFDANFQLMTVLRAFLNAILSCL